MVALNRIYTRQGDDGTSGLVTGPRRSKSDPRFEAIGMVDETNAVIGLARLHADALGPEIDAALGRIQNDLFDLGADLATPEPPKKGPVLRIADTQVARLEAEIDAFNAALEPLRSFVLPGGSAGAAALHLARTVCRRTERVMVALRESGEPLEDAALRYVNRLSDLLFVLSRVANDGGRSDVLWVPGENR